MVHPFLRWLKLFRYISYPIYNARDITDIPPGFIDCQDFVFQKIKFPLNAIGDNAIHFALIKLFERRVHFSQTLPYALADFAGFDFDY